MKESGLGVSDALLMREAGSIVRERSKTKMIICKEVPRNMRESFLAQNNAESRNITATAHS